MRRRRERFFVPLFPDASFTEMCRRYVAKRGFPGLLAPRVTVTLLK